jgi:hypothetical protein
MVRVAFFYCVEDIYENYPGGVKLAHSLQKSCPKCRGTPSDVPLNNALSLVLRRRRMKV